MHLVRIAAHTRHTLHPEIEWFQPIPNTSLCICLAVRKASAFEEWYDERPEATINVKTNVMLQGNLPESYDTVLVAIWVVYGRTNDLAW